MISDVFTSWCHTLAMLVLERLYMEQRKRQFEYRVVQHSASQYLCPQMGRSLASLHDITPRATDEMCLFGCYCSITLIMLVAVDT